MRRTPLLTCTLALSACLLASACSSDEPTLTAGSTSPAPDAAAPSPTGDGADAGPETEPTPSPAPAAEAPAGDRDLKTGEPSGGPLTVTEVRVARQDGFDRVVFELDGDAAGEPGWRVQYVDDPRRDGSGDPVEVDGEAVLVVLISGTGYPFDTGREEAASATVPGDAEVVSDVVLGSVFEGTYEAFVGLDGERPFTVTRLADPARIVVDVQHG